MKYTNPNHPAGDLLDQDCGYFKGRDTYTDPTRRLTDHRVSYQALGVSFGQEKGEDV